MPNIFDVLPRYAAALADPSIPLWITEGAKKSDALASVYGSAIVPINENGVWGWRSTNTQGGKTAIADFDLIAWENRTIIIAPDGDVRYNKHVLGAVQRLAQLLIGRYKATDVYILQLPQTANGPKIGVDDFLATGQTTTDLEMHLTSLGTVTHAARIPMGAHPEKGLNLFLPAGYDVQAQTIVRVDKNGSPTSVYSGAIFVSETGVDLLTRERSDVITWNGRGNDHGEVIIPHAALSDTRTFSGLVGGAGAAIGPKNIKDVMQFLVDFIQENREVLPHRSHTERLGLIGHNLLLPAGPIGFDEPVRYAGRHSIQIGSDASAYPSAIRAMLNWSNAWTAWLTVGLSLASPAIARLNLRRNPVVYLSGTSGSGKTTLAQFAIGCWGDPTRNPLRVESGRTTPAGIFQTLEHLGGLPALVDEAHTVPDPKRLELACYGFANGQTYTKGGVDGKARGGETIGGTLLLAGEALPEFKHAGSRLRVLWVDTGSYPPLGAEPRSAEGQERAQQLEHAWTGGAGLIGHSVAARIWADWPGFLAEVRALQSDPALAPLGPWAEPLAAAAAALNVAFRAIGISTAPTGFDQLLEQWAAMLLSGQHDTDPSVDAWLGLVTMLVQGRHSSGSQGLSSELPGHWDYIEGDRGGVIACKKPNECYWRVLINTPQFEERLGESAVQLHGKDWIKRRWVLAAPDGKSSTVKRVHTGASLRVLCVPVEALEHWNDE